MVLRVMVEFVRGVHVHHTDLPPECPAWSGSASSLVALALLPVLVLVKPIIGIRLLNASFTANGSAESSSENLPPTSPHASTAIWYIVPAVASKVTLPGLVARASVTNVRFETALPV